MININNEIKTKFSELLKRSDAEQHLKNIDIAGNSNILNEMERYFSLSFIIAYNKKKGIIYIEEDLKRERLPFEGSLSSPLENTYKFFFLSGLTYGRTSTLSLVIAPEEINKFTKQSVSFTKDVRNLPIEKPYYSFNYESTFYYELSDIYSNPDKVLNEFININFSSALSRADNRMYDRTRNIADNDKFKLLLSDQKWNKKFIVSYALKSFINGLYIGLIQYNYPTQMQSLIEKLSEPFKSIRTKLSNELEEAGFGKDIIDFHLEYLGKCVDATNEIVTSHECEILLARFRPKTDFDDSGIFRFEMFISANTFGSF